MRTTKIYIICTYSETAGRIVHDAHIDGAAALADAKSRAEGLADDCGGWYRSQPYATGKTPGVALIAPVEVLQVLNAAGEWVLNVELYEIEK